MYAEVKGTTLLLRYLLRPEVRNRTISHCVDTSLKVASTSGHEKSDSSVNTDKVLNKTQRWIWIKRSSGASGCQSPNVSTTPLQQ